MNRYIARSLFYGGVVLAVGVGGMLILLNLRKAPAEASTPKEERSIRVAGLRATPEDIVVRIEGYGEVRPVRTVEIAPGVSGSVTSVHANLVVGGAVLKDEILFAIDPWVYETQLAEIDAQLGRWDATLNRLETELNNDQERLKTLSRTRDLAKTKYDRAVELFEQAIGNRTEMEEAEQHYNDTFDRVDLLRRQVAIYPALIEETRQSMAADQARKTRAEISIAQTQIRAPFDARITETNIEEASFVSVGSPVLTLADDSSLEIAVKLDAKDAREWLRFDGEVSEGRNAWFTGLNQVPCDVRWIEESEGAVWKGVLDRVEEFDPASRTLTVTIRVDGDEACARERKGLPLVAGMFCEVSIPGRVLHDVYRLPQWAVSVDGAVFLAKDDRLKPAPVEILYTDGETVFVSGAIQPSDTIVTTRLINPIANTLLDVALEDAFATTD